MPPGMKKWRLREVPGQEQTRYIPAPGGSGQEIAWIWEVWKSMPCPLLELAPGPVSMGRNGNSYELCMANSAWILFPCLTNYFGYVERKMEYEERVKRLPPPHVSFIFPIWKMEQFYKSHEALHLKTCGKKKKYVTKMCSLVRLFHEFIHLSNRYKKWLLCSLWEVLQTYIP